MGELIGKFGPLFGRSYRISGIDPGYVENHKEGSSLTPDDLKSDNQGRLARELSAKWERNRANGNLWAIVTCGDARILIPRSDNTISIRSIFAGGKKEKKIFMSPGVKQIVVMGHFDGTTIIPGKRIKGCGGAAAKEEALNGSGEEHAEDYKEYIKTIEHSDPIMQTYATALKIFEETGKPTLAVLQDHRTGKIYTVATFEKDKDGHEHMLVNSRVKKTYESREYNEAYLYEKGIPILSERRIPEIFMEYINANKEYVAELNRAYPNLSETQKIQNPIGIWASTKLPSIRTRYPEITKGPHSFFKLHAPREKNELSKKTEVNAVMRKEIINQIHYPIKHAIENFGKPNEQFSRTNRVIIETSDIHDSLHLAQELAEKSWMKKWLALDDDHKIIVIQNKGGVSDIIEYFNPQLN